jgi:hypothetical protein
MFSKEIGLMEMPEFLYEGHMQFNANENVFKVQSTYLEYNVPFIGAIDQKRDLLINLLFQKPYKTKPEDKAQSFAFGTLKFEGMKAPIKLKSLALKGKETEWMPIPAVNDQQKNTAKDNEAVFVYTLVATVTETKDANAYLKLFSDVFEGSKEGVKKVIIDIVPKPEAK